MLKLISVVLIFTAGLMVSREYTLWHKNENRFTKGLISVFEYMAGEIVFEHKFLGETLKNASQFGGCAKEYIEAIAENIINKASAKEAFLTVKAQTDNMVYDILYEYFLQAGMYDAKTEKEKLENVIFKLKKADKEQEEYIKGTVNQNKKIIVATAVFVCVFMV